MIFQPSVMNLFSVPIYKGILESLTTDLKDFIKSQEYELMHSGTGHYSSNHKFLDLPELKLLKEEVDQHVEIFVREILNISKEQQFYHTTSWALRHCTGNFAKPHFHCNSLISGVFYLNQDEDFGALVFEKTTDNLFPKTLDISFDHWTPLNSASWSLQPVANMIILFPSNLMHSVSENKSKDTRYSVAFNYFVKGRFGYKESELHLH